ncbi:Uncharacterized protein FWK35_00036210, partial [Aphis craccivora]
DIPQILVYESTTYELRGALHFYKGKSRLRNSVGHYTAYAKRGTHSWELYDDLKKRPIPVKENSTILCTCYGQRKMSRDTIAPGDQILSGLLKLFVTAHFSFTVLLRTEYGEPLVTLKFATSNATVAAHFSLAVL